MTTLIPNRSLFSFEFPLRYRARPPKLDGTLDGWTDNEALPRLGQLDGVADFADIRACWNKSGLYLAVRVDGKEKPLRCDPARYWDGDNVRLCTDMRDARSNRRATRFCQQFHFLPQGGGKRGKEPVVGSARIQRATADAPQVPAESLEVRSSVSKTGYSLEARIPTRALSGFDPDEHPRIGFYLLVEDRELGQQFPTVGDDLAWHVDPSTWPTAVLVK